MSAPSSERKKRKKKKEPSVSAARRKALRAELERLADHFRNQTEFLEHYGPDTARCPTMDEQESWMQ